MVQRLIKIEISRRFWYHYDVYDVLTHEVDDMKKLIALFMIIMMLTACGEAEKEPEQPEETPDNIEAPSEPLEELPEEEEPIPEPEPENIFLSFTAVGDNLLHNTLSFDSRLDGGGYDFGHIYAPIAPYIKGSDVAFINQEVPLNGEVGSYPSLAAPQEAAKAIADIGFNAAALANNHMADKGASGLIKTVEALNNAGFEAIAGGYADKETSEKPVIIEKKGIKIGLLAYTYGINSGIGESWMIDRIGTDKITADVNEIRPQCDFLAVSMHWGNEYQAQPSQGQQEFAALLASLDVDLIIGHHPHVIQPAQWLSQPDGGEALCVYSLGNFVSNQREQDRMLGAMLRAELEFSPEGEFIGFKEADLHGVVTHFNNSSRGFAVYMLDDYTEELAASHGLHKYGLPFSLEFLQNRMAAVKESVKR